MNFSIGITKIPLSKQLGKLLLQEGLIREEELKEALEKQELLKKEDKYIRIGDLLHSEFKIDRGKIEKVFLNDFFSRILTNLKKLIKENRDISDQLNFRIIRTSIYEEKDILKGNLDLEVFFPDNKDNSFLLNLPFDYKFSDNSSKIDLVEAINQIKKGLNEASDISSLEQSQLGIRIEHIKNLK